MTIVNSVALAMISAPTPRAESVKNTAFVARIPSVAMKPARNPLRIDRLMTSRTAGPGVSDRTNSVTAKRASAFVSKIVSVVA